MSTGDLITRVYGGFRGVDFRGEEINLLRSPDSLNVWKDYRETESIRTRPGMKLFETFTQPVYGVFFYKNDMLVQSGRDLYCVKNAAQPSGSGVLYPITVRKLYSDLSLSFFTGRSYSVADSFIYDDIWYFKDGRNYLQYDGETIKEVEGYIPTTSIARKPAGGGTKYEDVNMLSDYRINTFLADGSSVDYYLDAQNIDAYKPIVKVNDKVMDSGYIWDYAKGKITFSEAPEAPLTDGRDNVSIQFKKTVNGYRESILGCTLLQVFDNRVFFSGNPDHPNTVWHCSLNDPTYVSDLDYYREGMDVSRVRGMVAGNNALWVFREPSDANTNVFYHTPTIDDEYGKIYPSTHSSVTTGCVGKAINFNDDIVFFSDRGMEGISGDITTEQVAMHRSSLVDRKLISEIFYKVMNLAEWEGYLLTIIGDKVYLADSRATFSNDGHLEYEWFYWQMEKRVNCAKVHDGTLYLGTDDGVYTLTDNECDIESYWTTPLDKFKNPNKLKTTNKRGCVAEATGDISVYAKTNKTDFELIGTYENVTDYFVSRIKRKKFKDIQLKFYSKTRFSLETASLECFIGGYVKR